MILLALVLVVAVVLAAGALVARGRAFPRPVVRAASRDVVAAVRAGAPYAYQYVLKGLGGRDVGDHDKDKLVVRADRVSDGIIVRVAPVDRAGKRTGPSKLLKIVK